MITTHRGLTLLEVLVATVIMAMMASALVPMFSSALRILQPKTWEGEVDQNQRIRFDLSRLADAFVINPAAFGRRDLVSQVKQGDFEVAWPKNPDQSMDVHPWP